MIDRPRAPALARPRDAPRAARAIRDPRKSSARAVGESAYGMKRRGAVSYCALFHFSDTLYNTILF